MIAFADKQGGSKIEELYELNEQLEEKLMKMVSAFNELDAAS